MIEVPVKIYITTLAKQAKAAAKPFSRISGEVRQRVLLEIADELDAHRETIVEANKEDIAGVSKELARDDYRKTLDRVRLDDEIIGDMVDRVREIGNLPDPIGEVTSSWYTTDGMQVSRRRVPIGVIAIISEMGPDVMAESLALCFKTANVCIYRGGVEWTATNAAIANIFREVLETHDIPRDAVVILDRPDREGVLELVRLPKYIDGVIPRGRAGLRKAVSEQSRVPVLMYDGGASHVYVDGDVEIPMAQNIVVNSKIQDPRASNSVDTVLIHQGVARHLLSGLLRRLLEEFKVDLIGCKKTTSLMGIMEMTGHKGIQSATEEHWGQKFQNLTMTVKIVKDMDEALAHIDTYGPSHTDCIVTRDYTAAMRFVDEVNASAVLVNASSRMHSGSQFDLGPEIGINTSSIFTRGPITLSALTSEKYVGFGFGHLRYPHPVPDTYQDAMMMSQKF
ncbi:MAG: glutamate-5-semialdehyde dehydrogenase [Nitrospirae bacterium]|nr:glutamate-5-semialdehyde dehydrogenase [Nitrospirota bacterium]